MLLTVRDFDLIPTLRTRPEYQLSADIHSHKASTKYPDKSPLTSLDQDFLSTSLGYEHSW